MDNRPIDTSKHPGETDLQHVERLTRMYQDLSAYALAESGVTGLSSAFRIKDAGGNGSLPIRSDALNVGRNGGHG